MNYYDIRRSVLEVFIECNIHSFPIDCIKILKHYGYAVYTYQELGEKNPALYEMCLAYSEDAFRDGANQIIAYNHRKAPWRIQFSLAHELGHHILKHIGTSSQAESEANYFAGQLLAPSMAIHYARCENANQVSHAFGISTEAAQIAFLSYLNWRDGIYMNQRKMSALDSRMYWHFYNESMKCFVWSIRTCEFCGKKLYNSRYSHCNFCTLPPANKSDRCHRSLTNNRYLYYLPEPDDNDLMVSKLHNRWLSPQ